MALIHCPVSPVMPKVGVSCVSWPAIQPASDRQFDAPKKQATTADFAIPVARNGSMILICSSERLFRASEQNKGVTTTVRLEVE